MAKFIRSQLLQSAKVLAIYSQRQEGLSPKPWDSLNLGLGLGDSDGNVQNNLQNLCQQASIPIPHQAQQVHSNQHIICAGQGIQHAQQADILISQTAGTALAVRTADCLPILLFDQHAGIAAAVHAGWRGTAMQVVQTAIEIMQQLGAKPKNILASLGPCIAPCCFAVDQKTANRIAQSHPDAQTYIQQRKLSYYPNLQAINRLQLRNSGIQSQYIEPIEACTCCLKQQFFSHRRDAKASGRQLAIVALPSSL